MPTMTKMFPCMVAGCPEFAVKGRSFCAQHAPPPRRTASVYGTARHKLWRKLVITRDPVCVLCHSAPSTQADHVIPLDQGGTWDLSNGQGTCAGCHARKTRRENRHPNPDFPSGGRG